MTTIYSGSIDLSIIQCCACAPFPLSFLTNSTGYQTLEFTTASRLSILEGQKRKVHIPVVVPTDSDRVRFARGEQATLPSSNERYHSDRPDPTSAPGGYLTICKYSDRGQAPSLPR